MRPQRCAFLRFGDGGGSSDGSSGGSGGGGGGDGSGVGGGRGISWDDLLFKDNSIFVFIEEAFGRMHIWTDLRTDRQTLL